MPIQVPKFSSFKPEPKPKPVVKEPDESSDATTHNRHAKRLKHRQEAQSRSSREKHRRDSRERPAKDPSTDARLFLSKFRQPSPPSGEHRDLWTVDSKGDHSIAKYGTIDRYTVPPYRRAGYGCILGLTSTYRIDYAESNDRSIVVSYRELHSAPRALASQRAFDDKSRSGRFVATSGLQRLDLSLDFMPITKPPKAKHELDTHATSEVDYRSLEREDDAGVWSDSDVEDEPAKEQDNRRSKITQRNAMLTQRTREHPKNLQAWLDLVAHQQAMITLDQEEGYELRTADMQHMAEIKISVYENALRKIGDNKNNQIQLQLGLMAQARQLWNEEKIEEKWRAILDKYPQDIALWMAHLEFAQTSFANFKFERCRTNFQDFLTALHDNHDLNSIEDRLHLMIRLTSMVRQAGYQELAIAIWQAILEYNIFRPPCSDLAKMMKLFEDFWESEALRLGEPGSRGWRQTVESPFDADLPPEPVLASVDSNLGSLKAFRDREAEHVRKLRYPGRTTDQLGEDDPFHLVIFLDVKEYLKLVPDGIPHEMIVDAFLCFCGLPPLPRSAGYHTKWWGDPILHQPSAASPPTISSESFKELLDTLLSRSYPSIQWTTEFLFDHAFENVAESIDTTFIRQVLSLVARQSAADDIIGEYLLAFEHRFANSSVLRSAKRLIKARPQSLKLYNAYGLVESRRGESAKADVAFSAALGLQKREFLFAAPGNLQLLRNWVLEALQRDDSKEALWRLVSHTGQVLKTSHERNMIPDDTAILRGRGVLRETQERAMLSNDHNSAVTATALEALLVYLLGDEDIQGALSVHARLTNRLDQLNTVASSAVELHAQLTAELIAYYIGNANIVKRAYIQQSLMELVERFPDNTILLSTQAASERRFLIDDRLRGIVLDTLSLQEKKPASTIKWSFAIQYEVSRGENRGSTTQSIRELYRKAENGASAYSPAIWTSHVLFELADLRREKERNPNKPRDKAGGKPEKRKVNLRMEDCYHRVKDTFFRGMRQLPWSKDFMMLAFTHLMEEKILTEEELREVYNVMVEKELRMHVELEDGLVEDQSPLY
ncbi:DUF1740-domain-containing protein [Polyplosphaeria fusca]|uniref:DUF1740-domain-containing protein n=1 Tax=Polyplosphaeria fusca TaxID=682080 RepID=A0A9P4QKD5_9PLEO|nr:DUF1740-domain-containing protein [Polyplosphaeria fusca]